MFKKNNSRSIIRSSCKPPNKWITYISSRKKNKKNIRQFSPKRISYCRSPLRKKKPEARQIAHAILDYFMSPIFDYKYNWNSNRSLLSSKAKMIYDIEHFYNILDEETFLEYTLNLLNKYDENNTLPFKEETKEELRLLLTSLDAYNCSNLPLAKSCDDTIYANHYISEQVKKYKLKKAKNPYFIITWGPPASGKGACRNQYLTDLKIKTVGALDILVDDIISMIKEYKIEVNQCIVSKEKKNCDMSKIYFQYREKGNKVRELVLNQALSKGYNIIWETTGKDVNRLQSLKKKLIQNGYRLIVLYPYVNLDKILIRNEERAKLIGRKPDPEMIKKVFTHAQVNLANILSLDQDIYKTIVYDNDLSSFCSNILLSETKETKGISIKCSKDWDLVIKPTDSPNLYEWMFKKCSP